MLKNLILVTTLLLSSFSFSMGHLDHEKSLHPVAKSGQMIVTYQGDCSKGNAKKAMQLIDKIIAYEKKNSPIKYSSAPGTWSDNSIGAVDLHDSEDAMNQAFDWQSNDKKWSDMFDSIAKTCGITTDDFDINIMEAK
tara:strand:+ start:54 stop:464 length:411 start_codon:yes stop_codon:yes gene_type:complete